jgi:Glycine rich protein
MQSRFRAKLILLAGTSMLALMAGAASASAETFDFTGSLQTFVATATGEYDITLVGAQGGQATGRTTMLGGKGAQMGGEVFLTVGETLTIVVGGQGAPGIANANGGGGGGGYSGVSGAGNLLAMAGGGGGASPDQNGGSGLTGNAGGNGMNQTGGAGGTMATAAAAVATAGAKMAAAARAAPRQVRTEWVLTVA